MHLCPGTLAAIWRVVLYSPGLPTHLVQESNVSTLRCFHDGDINQRD